MESTRPIRKFSQCVRTLVEPNSLPKIGPSIPPAKASTGAQATTKFVRDMNKLVIQSAENIVLASEQKPYIPLCVEKYRNWRVRTAKAIHIPAVDGYYELIQTRVSAA